MKFLCGVSLGKDVQHFRAPSFSVASLHDLDANGRDIALVTCTVLFPLSCVITRFARIDCLQLFEGRAS
eukprot:6472851-Amphidinium_carterae.1